MRSDQPIQDVDLSDEVENPVEADTILADKT